jgi:hypothetical protein
MEMSQAQLKRRIKVEQITGYGSLIGGIILIIIFPVVSIIQGNISPMLIVRGIIVTPFVIWYGIRCRNKAKELREVLNNAKSK